MLLLEDIFKYLHHVVLLPASTPPSEIALQLVQLQASFASPYLRASVFRSLNELAHAADIHACDERLQRAVEVTLTTLATDLPAADGARFCLLVSTTVSQGYVENCKLKSDRTGCHTLICSGILP